MDRREVLRYTALITGAAISAPLAGSLLVSCKPEPGTKIVGEGAKLHFFDAESFGLVNRLVDLILPKTDSPAASEVGVDKMIDQMVGLVYAENDRKAYQAKFAKLTAFLKDQKLEQAEEAKGLDILSKLESGTGDEKDAFLTLKQQTIAYYLSTEEIGTKFLNYLPIPGDYDACVSVEEVGNKRWAE